VSQNLWAHLQYLAFPSCLLGKQGICAPEVFFMLWSKERPLSAKNSAPGAARNDDRQRARPTASSVLPLLRCFSLFQSRSRIWGSISPIHHQLLNVRAPSDQIWPATCRDTVGLPPILSLDRQCCRNSPCAQQPSAETAESIASASLCSPFPAKCAHPNCLSSRVQSSPLLVLTVPIVLNKLHGCTQRACRIFALALLLEFLRGSVAQGRVQSLPIVILLDEFLDV
jgi:hypothetical protein